MDWFLLLKTLHILSAIVAVGANVTYGFWIPRAEREPAHLGFTLRAIRLLDERVANPAYGLLLATGLVMAFTRYSISTTWILTGLALYVVLAGVATAVFSPGLRRQIAALDAGGVDGAAYRSARATTVGVGLFIAVLLVVVVADMVFKPLL